jgi:hypothetical protein
MAYLVIPVITDDLHEIVRFKVYGSAPLYGIVSSALHQNGDRNQAKLSVYDIHLRDAKPLIEQATGVQAGLKLW